MADFKLSKIKLIIAILFHKGFFWKLEGTIEYALNTYDKIRGTGASDVLLFNISDSFNFIQKNTKI